MGENLASVVSSAQHYTKGTHNGFCPAKNCRRTQNQFYKVEEKGESIHATMNDIERKCWVIKNKQARLWKIIERYEMRNVTNVDIVVPIKRVLKNKHM